ncbi:porwaprin-b-like [Elgaria multicarinata webbii]|uniref:porwaprin-b-like n=1 Tax=Elgaria multicarinata webbii TaxID=159646 RepID=UPI002FCD30E6
MKMLSSLLLVSVLIIWAELPAAALLKIPVKPGTCPRDICRCVPPPQPDRCQNDHSCGGKQKCCYFCCVRSCRDPEQGKN